MIVRGSFYEQQNQPSCFVVNVRIINSVFQEESLLQHINKHMDCFFVINYNYALKIYLDYIYFCYTNHITLLLILTFNLSNKLFQITADVEKDIEENN